MNLLNRSSVNLKDISHNRNVSVLNYIQPIEFGDTNTTLNKRVDANSCIKKKHLKKKKSFKIT